jgi:hypothetical protein
MITQFPMRSAAKQSGIGNCKIQGKYRRIISQQGRKGHKEGFFCLYLCGLRGLVVNDFCLWACV